MTRPFFFGLAIALAAACTAPAQRTLEYDRSVVSQARIDLRDLGYPPADVIPNGESGVRALAVAPNGSIFGATSGKRSHLFVLDPLHGYVQPLGFLKGVSTVHRALVVSKSGDVFIGGSIGVDNNAEGYSGYAGGSLLRYSPAGHESKPIRIDQPAEVTDLGIPVKGEGIYAMAIEPGSGVVYGLTYPSGQFFSYRENKFQVHGSVTPKAFRGEKFEKDRMISRAIAVHGMVAYMSGEDGYIWRFNGAQLQKTEARLPAPLGREEYNRADAFSLDAAGALYGGTSDGYLFRMDPGTMTVENLGKPLNQYRIRGLAFAPDGRLFGVGGDDDEMARLFSYDPRRGTYEMLGFVDVNRRPHYMWQAYTIDAVAAGRDGTIYLGQNERVSKLYLYYPEMRPPAR